MEQLKEMAKTFNAETKKMFKSCKFAALNIYCARQDWAAWGDFKTKKDTREVARMWAMAFKHKPEITIEGDCYRVIVKI